MLSSALAEEKAANRSILIKIIQNLCYLEGQGISLRGHDESESNFIQLLLLRGKDNPKLYEWIKRRSNKYTSPEIQNSLLQVMSNFILRTIASDIRNSNFYNHGRECRDESNKEQLALCFRWLDEFLEVHEEFIGLYHIIEYSVELLRTFFELSSL